MYIKKRHFLHIVSCYMSRSSALNKHILLAQNISSWGWSQDIITIMKY